MWARTLPCLMALPSQWRHAVRLLPQVNILPGGPDQKYAAFLGDKFLGAVVAIAIQNSNETYDKASASRLTSTILSNKFLAARVESILPLSIYTDAAKLVSDHSVGTMVEAAVAAVKDEDAVADLVTWLIEEARNLDMNAKGQLLEFGGTVDSIRVGGSDHAPVFKAMARLDDQTVEATGKTRKDAEHNAANTCLLNIGYEIRIREERETQVMDPAPLNQWNLFELDENNARVVLKEETLLEWWLRGAVDPKRAFHRALLTPLVFPELIICIDSWTRQSGIETAALTVITYSIDDTQSCSSFVHVSTSSGNKARAAVGIEINKFVSELLSIQVPVSVQGE
jgi:dsRNA-specific ribonuclease